MGRSAPIAAAPPPSAPCSISNGPDDGTAARCPGRVWTLCAACMVDSGRRKGTEEHAMANGFSDNAFTARQALDPGLRKAARFLPRGNALHRGYRIQRALMNLMGNAGRIRSVPVAAV